MTLTKQGSFTFNHADQQDDLYKAMSSQEIKQGFDSRAEQLKTTLNNMIDALSSTTKGNSGAQNIAAESIPGLTGNDVQSLLFAMKNQIDSTVLGQLPPGVAGKLIDSATTTGNANAYVVTLSSNPTSYLDLMGVAIKIHVDSTGPSTLNVNGLGAIPLKKSNGQDYTNLKANGVYTFRYNSSTGNFILQGEGGSGTATEGDILIGKTATTDAGDIIGTMMNRGAMTITPGTTDQIIPTGYHNGSGKVQGDPNLIPDNIINGKSIFGVAGNFDGKQYTSGTVTSSSAKTYFTWISGTQIDLYSVSVSGLPFQPKKIILTANLGAGNAKTVYTDSAKNVYQKTVEALGYNMSNTNATIYVIKGDVSPASVGINSFVLPVTSGSAQYTWEAIG